MWATASRRGLGRRGTQTASSGSSRSWRPGPGQTPTASCCGRSQPPGPTGPTTGARRPSLPTPRGFFLASNAPFGYKHVKVNDGVKDRPTLEVDPAAAPVVREIFEKSLRGSGLKEICKELNDRGVTNRGKRWYKGTLHYVLRNEAYTGGAVWGRTSKGEKTQDPVRIEGAWPALISRELFDEVQQAMRDRAPMVRKPGRVGSKFLLSGLLKCGVCGRPCSAQGAKSGQFAYYICGTLFREGAGTCSARYLNAPRVEDFVVEKIRERILTEETIVELVTLVAGTVRSSWRLLVMTPRPSLSRGEWNCPTPRR